MFADDVLALASYNVDLRLMSGVLALSSNYFKIKEVILNVLRPLL